jgi:SAM-dependent methyltransferase
MKKEYKYFMHRQARHFLEFIKKYFPEFLQNKVVLDVGSGDINGNNQWIFSNCQYIGNDVFSAPNVSIVSKTSELPFENDTFDSIVSSECFEHDPEYIKSFQKILAMLKPGGLFFFTCATIGRGEHGTIRTTPKDSYGTIGKVEGWTNYYKNVSLEDLDRAVNLNENFSQWKAYYNPPSGDIYFWGIKKSDPVVFVTVPNYVTPPMDWTIEIGSSESWYPPFDYSLTTIFDKYTSDKNSFFHNYCRQYATLLQPLRNKPLRILELGVAGGESLKCWRDVFPNATCIVGVDISPDSFKFQNPEKNVYVEIGDATNKEFIQHILEKYNNFDLIIDDASHTNRDVIQSFEVLFPLLNDNGLYIVEDTICYKSQPHIKPGFPNHLDYFTSFVPFLNQWRYDSTNSIRDHCVDPLKILKKTDNVFEYSIDKIEFGCSYIAISKKIRWHWIPK